MATYVFNWLGSSWITQILWRNIISQPWKWRPGSFWSRSGLRSQSRAVGQNFPTVHTSDHQLRQQMQLGFSSCYTVYQCLKHFYMHLSPLKCWGQTLPVQFYDVWSPYHYSKMFKAATEHQCFTFILFTSLWPWRKVSIFFPPGTSYRIFLPRNKAETHTWD